jgi:hypothetical protein
VSTDNDTINEPGIWASDECQPPGDREPSFFGGAAHEEEEEEPPEILMMSRVASDVEVPDSKEVNSAHQEDRKESVYVDGDAPPQWDNIEQPAKNEEDAAAQAAVASDEDEGICLGNEAEEEDVAAAQADEEFRLGNEAEENGQCEEEVPERGNSEAESAPCVPSVEKALPEDALGYGQPSGDTSNLETRSHSLQDVASDERQSRSLENSMHSEVNEDKLIYDHEIASNEEQPSTTEDNAFPSRVSSATTPVTLVLREPEIERPPSIIPKPRDSESELADVSDLPPVDVPPRPKPKAAKPGSSMLSFLVDVPEKQKRPPTSPAVVHRQAPIVKRVKPMIDLLNRGTPVTTAAPTTKKIAPAVLSRKVAATKLPEWQASLSSIFLMTPDMSYQDDDRNIMELNPEGGPSEIDQITEETTRCLCNSTHESEVMIQCDSCKKWLHEDCVRLQNSREADPFICIFCQHELSRSIKSYLRRKTAAFPVLMQQLQSDFQYQAVSHSKSIWTDLLQIVNEAQDVLAMIPLFLPANEDVQGPPDSLP